MPHFEGDQNHTGFDSDSSSPGSSSAVMPLEGAQTSSSPVKRKQDLDNMFDDEYDDPEFDEKELLLSEAALASSPPRPVQGQPLLNPARPPPSSNKHVSPELMQIFYERLFPFKDLFQWLNHFPSPTTTFTNREFAFTLQNDVYLRYNAFPTYDAMKKEVIRLLPSRFEIGPVYSANPRDRKLVRKAAFKPLEKELVFDIDMTDYDDIRTCCEGANICHKCWSFITIAIKVIDVALREDFGFQHILWVYSGRRGAHAWVCDRRARLLDDNKRRAIATYLEIVRGGAQSSKKVNIRRPLHPLASRSLNVLRDSFVSNILRDQNPWDTPERAEKLLKLLPDRALADALKKRWQSDTVASDIKWKNIDEVAKEGVSPNLDPKQLREAKQDIILEYMYPRLDAEVSKHLNHLLKSPFCVHPGTGRVCVPINASKPETFNPEAVPTLSELVDEINDWEVNNKRKADSGEKISDFDKTSLKPYVEHFHRFVTDLMKDEMKEKRQREQENGETLEF
ncbi:hypothetical protein V1514DRAFT_332278 [Lipomyces japonicus]|uniref:uncharacterized protein n=1 Tax=Lipomyces japonicus TaxID=56871 RepID=UPI0034CD9682